MPPPGGRPSRPHLHGERLGLGTDGRAGLGGAMAKKNMGKQAMKSTKNGIDWGDGRSHPVKPSGKDKVTSGGSGKHHGGGSGKM